MASSRSSSSACSSSVSTIFIVDTRCWASTARQASPDSRRRSDESAAGVQVRDDMHEAGNRLDERQRLVLARAILRNPSILILDEATSALDTENEVKIQEAIERLKGKITIIVIAHRLSTIRNADQVVVFEDGEIIQQGEYVQLSMEKKGMFRKLVLRQMEGIK